MSGINIITADFTNNKRATVTRKLYKGDYGQKIQVKGLDLPEFFQVHFSHNLREGIAKKIIGQNNEIPIPDEYLITGKTIYVWIFLHKTSQDGETRHTIVIPVINKPDVVPVQPTPVEQDTITQTIALLTEVTEDAEAWAVGKKNGIDVSPNDETYHNNAKYYSEQAEIFKEQSESNVRHYPKIIDGYWYLWDFQNNEYTNSWQKAQGDRDSILQTASGNIVYISDGGANLPIEELIVNITPEQYGSGTPIYYNIRPFKPGRTQVTIETRGKNLFNQSRFPLANFPKITDSNNIYYNSYYGSLRDLGYNSTSIFHVNNGGFVGKVPIDDIVNVSFDIQNVLPRTYLQFFYMDGTNSGYSHFIGQNGFYGHYSVHSDENKKVTAVNINTLGNASSYSGIKNLQIERGTEETEYDNYAKSYSINWAETAEPIYGGYIDVIKGKLVKTHDIIQSYQGENLLGQWYSDRDVYDGNNQPTIGAQVVYELTEPVFYQLDPVDIRTVLGINNIWADNGFINVKYRADQNLYIEAQLKQAKDSGQFDGRGIKSIVTNDDYTLTFTYTDEETYTTPFSVRGQDGYTPVKGVDYFTEEQINNIINTIKQITSAQITEELNDINVYQYKGSVENFTDLPNNAKSGDVYNVIQAYNQTPAGTNWAWTGQSWDALGGVVNIETATDLDILEMLKRLALINNNYAILGEAIVGESVVINDIFN